MHDNKNLVILPLTRQFSCDILCLLSRFLVFGGAKKLRHRGAFLLLFDNQLLDFLANFRAQCVSLFGIANSYQQTGRAIQLRDFPQFSVIQPAQNTGRKALRFRFRCQVSGGNTNIDGAVVIIFQLRAQRSRFDIGTFGMMIATGAWVANLFNPPIPRAASAASFAVAP